MLPLLNFRNYSLFLSRMYTVFLAIVTAKILRVRSAEVSVSVSLGIVVLMGNSYSFCAYVHAQFKRSMPIVIYLQV